MFNFCIHYSTSTNISSLSKEMSEEMYKKDTFCLCKLSPERCVTAQTGTRSCLSLTMTDNVQQKQEKLSSTYSKE